jgi:hypothetical protein
MTESLMRNNIKVSNAAATYYWNTLNDTLRATKGRPFLMSTSDYSAFIDWIKENEKLIRETYGHHKKY